MSEQTPEPQITVPEANTTSTEATVDTNSIPTPEQSVTPADAPVAPEAVPVAEGELNAPDQVAMISYNADGSPAQTETVIVIVEEEEEAERVSVDPSLDPPVRPVPTVAETPGAVVAPVPTTLAPQSAEPVVSEEPAQPAAEPVAPAEPVVPPAAPGESV